MQFDEGKRWMNMKMEINKGRLHVNTFTYTEESGVPWATEQL